MTLGRRKYLFILLVFVARQQRRYHGVAVAQNDDESSRMDPTDTMVVDGPSDEYDDRTLLDVFGEAAKEYLTQKVIPDTDVECKWDWRFVRCEPFCECDFLPKRGDYHLGRSCRRTVKDHCEPGISAPTNPLQIVIQRLVRGTQQGIHSVTTKAKAEYKHLQTNVCKNMSEIRCSDEPPIMIAWQERLLCRHKIPDCTVESNSKPSSSSVDSSQIPGNQRQVNMDSSSLHGDHVPQDVEVPEEQSMPMPASTFQTVNKV